MDVKGESNIIKNRKLLICVHVNHFFEVACIYFAWKMKVFVVTDIKSNIISCICFKEKM